MSAFGGKADMRRALLNVLLTQSGHQHDPLGCNERHNFRGQLSGNNHANEMVGANRLVIGECSRCVFATLCRTLYNNDLIALTSRKRPTTLASDVFRMGTRKRRLALPYMRAFRTIGHFCFTALVRRTLDNLLTNMRSEYTNEDQIAQRFDKLMAKGKLNILYDHCTGCTIVFDPPRSQRAPDGYGLESCGQR